MEGIETADAILAQVYPKTDFETKDRLRMDRASIDIHRLKLDRLEKLLVPALPVSLIMRHDQQIGCDEADAAGNIGSDPCKSE